MASFFDQFGKLHAWVYRRNGRLGRRFAWVPTLVVGTTGRKSGDRASRCSSTPTTATAA